MNVFQVTTQISALRKGLVTLGAGEGALACVLAEVVAQVTALLEDRATARVPAAEVQLDPHGVRVAYLDGLVPGVGNTFEGFRLHTRSAAQFRNFGALDHGVNQSLRLLLATGSAPRCLMVSQVMREAKR